MMRSITCAILVLLCGTILRAQPPASIDPNACTLQEIGRMEGWITTNRQGAQQFGIQVARLGDVNHDGLDDWVASYYRSDSPMVRGGLDFAPLRLRLYLGQEGGLPPSTDGAEIGPNELNSDVVFLTSGDFDGDSNRDLVVSIMKFNDSSEGAQNYSPKRLVVYWGNGSGDFSNSDTTHLENLHSLWYSLSAASVQHISNESTDRLIVRGGGTIVAGNYIRTPVIYEYSVGVSRHRWGRDSVPRTAAWTWWGGSQNTMSLIDQDGDGLQDLCFVASSSIPEESGIGIAYGEPNGYFDTVNIESITMEVANGYSTIYTDLTGDGLPEIACLTGNDDEAKVYIGKKGQRLLQQYGTGDDPPHPGNDDWWGRPWATIWMPNKVGGGGWFTLGIARLFALGDVGRDRVGDLVVESPDNLLIYNGGEKLDSLIDGSIPWPQNQGAVARLGNIDGSGLNVIAIHSGATPGTVSFYHPDSCITRTTPSVYRTIPDSTGPAAVEHTIITGPSLDLSVTPRPAHDHTTLSWVLRSGTISLAVSDLAGRELQRWTVPAAVGSLRLDLTRWSRGAYLVTLTTLGRSTTEQLIVE